MKLPPAERDNIQADARAFLNSAASKYLFDELEKQYINDLKSLNVGDLRAAAAHASLRVLEDVKAQLNLIVQSQRG